MKNNIKKFLIIVFSIVGVFVGLGSVGLYAHSKFSSNNANNSLTYQQNPNTNINNKNNDEGRDGFFARSFLPPKKTNFLILGNDYSDLLTDVIILGSFDRDTNNIDLISIPRDTYTTISPELRAFIEGNGRWVPRFMKLNELHAYAGKNHGGEAIKRRVQEMFNIEIDYIISMELDGFVEIVDILGPIEFEIPRGGLFYHDPTQNLRISLPEGVQMLDGKMAEGLVRYRQYTMGDLDRIDTQQEFMKEFFRQALQKDNIINNIIPIVTTIFDHVDTDFNILNLPKYAPYIGRFSPENLRVQMLPGEPAYINSISYFIHDQQASQSLIDSILKNYSDLRHIEPVDLRIQIFNAGEISNAVYIAEQMTEAGFNVMFFGSYEGEKIEKTRIITPFNIDLENVLLFFNNAEIIEEHLEDDRFDLVIIIK